MTCLLKVLNEYSPLITTIVTLLLLIVAYRQLRSLVRQSKADFVFKFDRMFFDPSNHKIIEAIDKDKDIFKNFTENQVVDYIGSFDLIKNYLDEGIMDLKLVDERFGYYITRAWQNEEIKRYVIELRKELQDNRLYRPFELLAEKLTAIEEKEKINYLNKSN